MIARKASTCTACGWGIGKGEPIVFERATGARHEACKGEPVRHRVNLKPATCAGCGDEVPREAGRLVDAEVQTEDGWQSRWKVYCFARCSGGPGGQS